MKKISDDELRDLCESKDFEYIGRIKRPRGKNGKTEDKIQFICNKHREKGVQEKTLDNLRLKGCVYCAGTNRRTTKEFINMVAQKNNNIEVIGEYVNCKTKITCKCKIDGTTWDAWPEILLRGGLCPTCNRKAIGDRSRKSPTDFTKEMFENIPNIEALEAYKTSKDSILFRCKVCGYEWKTQPYNILSGHSGCIKCSWEKMSIERTKSNEDFLRDLKETNPMLEALEPYITNKQKILVRCKIHNYEWRAIPAQLLYRKVGCPKCSASYNETKLSNILTKWGYSYELQKRFKDCKDKAQLPFDIYLPKYNVCIEYDGEQHYDEERFKWRDSSHSSFNLTKKHDEIKNKYCLDHEVPLIRIPYWEANNMESFLYDKFIEIGIAKDSIILN